MKNTVLFFFLTFFSLSVLAAEAARPSYVQYLIDEAKSKNLALDIQWLNLGHYKKTFFGDYQSQVDSDVFFVAPDGKDNPDHELEATLKGFFSASAMPVAPVANDAQPDAVQCRFPARLIWLKKILMIDPKQVPAIDCEKFSDFRKKLSAQSATLIFSSFYLNNPSSAFGHTFLRMNSTKSIGIDGQHHELLDHGVNYAAQVTTENPILYAFFGTIGVFRGTFTSVPYYYKVREYNDYEARDLWGYDLNLTPEELELLVAHVWELGPAYYDYFYFTENCSYHMFTTIEAAAPRYKLTDRLNKFVIPSDTIRALMKEPGLVKGIHYRPSVRTQFEYRLKDLNDSEKDVLSEVLGKSDLSLVPDSMPLRSKVRILDTASDYMEFRHPEDLVTNKSVSSQWKQSLLLTRAKLGVRSYDFIIPAPQSEAPHLGHASRRFTLQQGYESTLGQYTDVGLRFALYDTVDPGPGYPPFSQIEFMNLNGRYQYRSTEAEIENVTLFRVTSLSPFTRYKKNVSFRVEMGLKRIEDRNCTHCMAAAFEAGPGLAFLFPGDRLMAFSIADAQLAYSPSFEASKFRMGAGPTLGIIFLATAYLKASASATYRYQLFSAHPDTYEAHGDIRYGLGERVAFDVGAARMMDSWKTTAAMMFYF